MLESEGVFSDNAKDPGGETWFGIARASHPSTPWPPSVDQAIEVYRTEYWLKCRCDALPWIFALPTFDAAVQHSPLRAIQFLQDALRVTVDGVIGQQTVDAAVSCADPKAALTRLMTDRVLFYVGCAGWPTFKTGWMTRVFKMTLAAI